MISLVLFCIALSSVAAVPIEKNYIPLTTEFLNEVRPSINKCEAETKPPSNTFQNLLNGIIDNDAARDFVYCYLYDAGFIVKDGHFVVSRIEKIVGDYSDKEKAMKAFVECTKRTGKDPLETVTLMIDCYRDDVPVFFTMNKAS